MNLSILDLLFPKRCVSCGRLGSYICTKCFSQIEFIEKPVCPVCQRQAIGGKTHPGCQGRYRLDGLVIACKYRGPVKKAIQKMKYKWIFDVGEVLINFLTDSLWKFDLPASYILVPIPLHPRRKKWRGFNQSELLAKILGGSFGVDVCNLLVRTLEGSTQVGLDRESRKENVKGAFAPRFAQSKSSSFNIEGKNIILVDDVYTSGATMAECAKVLKKAGAKEVWAMAVALG